MTRWSITARRLGEPGLRGMWARICLVAVLLASGGAVAWAGEPPKESPATLKLDLARELHRQQFYEMAFAAYEEFIQAFPDEPRLPQALFGLADCAYQLEQYARAAETFDRFLSDPHDDELHPYALGQLGHCRLLLEQYDLAAKALHELQALPPPDELQARTAFWLGQAYYNQEKYDPALEAFGKVVDAPGGDAKFRALSLFWAGDIHQRAGRYEQAISSYGQLLAEPADAAVHAEARFRQGECYQLLGHHQDAINAFQQLEGDAEFAASALYGRALSRFALKEYAEAIKLLDQHIAMDPTGPAAADAAIKKCWAYRHMGDKHNMARIKACLAYLDAYPDGPDAGDARFLLGEAYSAVGQVEDAIASFEAVPAGAPYYQEAKFRVALAYHQARDLPAAAAAYDSLLAEFPNHERADDALMQAGLIYVHLAGSAAAPEEQAALCAKAQQRFKQFLKTFPEHDEALEALFALGRCQRLAGDYVQMADTFLQYAAADKAPRAGMALFWVGRYRQWEADTLRNAADAARRKAQEATVADEPQKEQLDTLRQQTREQLAKATNWYEQAVDAYNRSILAGGANVGETRLRFAQSSYAVGECRALEARYLHDDAQQAQQQQKKEDAAKLESHATETSAAAQRALDVAAATFKAVIEDQPNLVKQQQIYAWTAARLRSQAKHADAIRIYKALLERWPETDTIERVLCELGMSYADLAEPDWSNSLRCFQQLLDHYAAVAAESPGKARPLAVFARYSKGVALKNLDRLDEAEHVLEQVVHTVPDGETLNIRGRVELGEVALRQGQRLADAGGNDDAQAKFKRATELLVSIGVMYEDPELTPRALFQAGRCWRARNDNEKGVRIWSDLLRRYPESPWADRAREELHSQGIVVDEIHSVTPE